MILKLSSASVLLICPEQFHRKFWGEEEAQVVGKSCHLLRCFMSNFYSETLRQMLNCADPWTKTDTPQPGKRMLTLVFNTFLPSLSELPTTILTPFPLGNQCLQEKNTSQLVITFD